MDWNILLKRTNKEQREERKKIFEHKRKLLEDYKTKLNNEIKKFQEEETIFYRIKDRFSKIYKIFAVIFIIWLIPLIIIISKLGGSIVNFIILILYLIITLPIFIITLTVPTVKFFAKDLPKIIDDVKVYASARYMIAIFFESNRLVVPILKKLDSNGHFEHKKLPYVTDKNASFLTVGKVSLSFYIENLPNPLKFNFEKYKTAYLEAKAEQPHKAFYDWEEKLVDVAYSSENLRDYKKQKLFEEFFRDHQSEINKVLFAVIGLCGTFCIIVLIMYFLKGG